MRYLALETFDMHLERVKVRADSGGHSASEFTLRRIHETSLANLAVAIELMDEVVVYDNSDFGGPPRLVLHPRAGEILAADRILPQWLAQRLG